MRKIFHMLAAWALIVFAFSGLALASSDVLVHLDNTGNALFLGSSSGNISSLLPRGVNFSGGNIFGNTQFQTSKSGDIWSFSFSLPDSNIEVFLPAGAKVKSTNGEITIDGGTIAVFANDNVNVSYSIGETPGTDWLLISIIVIILAFAIWLLYHFRSKIRKRDEERAPAKKKAKSARKKQDKIELFQKILSVRENLIVDALKDKGKMKSSVLRKTTGIPKSAFFRHIQELEKKNIIKRSGDGRNKIIELVK